VPFGCVNVTPSGKLDVQTGMENFLRVFLRLTEKDARDGEML